MTEREIPAGLQRVVIEMGMGSDLHGMDYTKAAGRAIEDALRRVSLPLLSALSPSRSALVVTLAVQEPEVPDLAHLASLLPHPAPQMRAVFGGLNVPTGAESIVIAQASIELFLPPQSGWTLRS